MLEKLRNLDRRIIFICIALAVIIPYILPVAMPIQVSNPVKNLYDFIDKLPEGSKVLMSFDYGPSTKIECDPMAIAVARHAFRKNLKLVAIALWPEGASQARPVLTNAAKEFNKTYGTDYINLGFKAGQIALLKSLGTDFHNNSPTDVDKQPIGSFPIMKEINTVKDFDLSLSFSAGKPGLVEHVVIDYSEFKVPVGGGVSAVMAPELYPYLNSGQLLGLMGGLKGAAEYEKLTDSPAEGYRGMIAQSIAHFTIGLFIILSNLFYFLSKSKKEAGK